MMPNLLPIGTEFDNPKTGLRLRVVAHVRNQYGLMAEQVVPVGPTVKKTGRPTRKNAVVADGLASQAAKAHRSHPRYRRRKTSSYNRVSGRTVESNGNPWAAIFWVVVIIAALVTLDQLKRRSPDSPSPPPYSHRR